MSIVPAILEQEKSQFSLKASQLERLAGVERIHIDFCDSQFVSENSLSVADIEGLNPAYTWEAHLMVNEPNNFLDYQIAGFNTIILHYEAFSKEVNLDDAAVEIKTMGMVPGIAINPETPVSVLRYFGDTINHFTLMSVHPGAQRNPFLNESFERITELRMLLPHATIEVDGGVTETNTAQLLKAGADMVVVGSALYNHPDSPNNIVTTDQSLIEKNFTKIQQAIIKTEN